MSIFVLTINGLPPGTFHRAVHAKELSEEAKQRRIVRSVQRWTSKPIRNHSHSRTKPGRVIFHQQIGTV